jgi:Mg/Co/Ni transporter MgtE
LRREDILWPAARHVSVLERLLAGDDTRAALRCDERGRLVGQISGADGVASTDIGEPRKTATASDLARPTQALTSAMTAAEVEQRFNQTAATHLPLVDPRSDRLVGMVTHGEVGA